MCRINARAPIPVALMTGVSAGVTFGFHLLANQILGSLIPLKSAAVYAAGFTLPSKLSTWAIQKIPDEVRNFRDVAAGANRWNLVIPKVILAVSCFFGNVANAKALTNLIYSDPISYSTALSISSLATLASLIYEFSISSGVSPRLQASAQVLAQLRGPGNERRDLVAFQHAFNDELARRLDQVSASSAPSAPLPEPPEMN